MPSVTNLAAQALSHPVAEISCSSTIVYTGAIAEAVFMIDGTSGPLASTLEIIVEHDYDSTIHESHWALNKSQLGSGQYPASELTTGPTVNGKPSFWGDESLLLTQITSAEDLVVYEPVEGQATLARQIAQTVEDLAF
jgi:hypothetical protein